MPLTYRARTHTRSMQRPFLHCQSAAHDFAAGRWPTREPLRHTDTLDTTPTRRQPHTMQQQTFCARDLHDHTHMREEIRTFSTKPTHGRHLTGRQHINTMQRQEGNNQHKGTRID